MIVLFVTKELPREYGLFLSSCLRFRNVDPVRSSHLFWFFFAFLSQCFTVPPIEIRFPRTRFLFHVLSVCFPPLTCVFFPICVGFCSDSKQSNSFHNSNSFHDTMRPPCTFYYHYFDSFPYDVFFNSFYALFAMHRHQFPPIFSHYLNLKFLYLSLVRRSQPLYVSPR